MRSILVESQTAVAAAFVPGPKETTRMKTISRIALALALFVGAAGLVQAADTETTLTGSLMCAKCTLKKADATKCQDVLVVKDDKGATTEYYIAKNEAADAAGHQCAKEAKATVTGAVSEKDGKKWITASKIEKQS
jgi:hypothetical protein